MKIKILACLLCFSFLLNVAGIIFFCSFLNLRGRYKSIRRERNQIAQNLTFLKGAGVLTEPTTPSKVYKRTFVSHFDGQEDTFGILPPVYDSHVNHTSYTLVVYLHGMGSNYIEPFVYPTKETIADAITKNDSNICFVSLNYRNEASWGNDTAISDITQNIREILQEFPIKRIVIMGTSMGGCTALTYAAISPPDINKKIAGVVSVESAGDLISLYNKSGHPALKPAMIRAFGGTPQQIPGVYQHKSFLSHLDILSPRMCTVIVSAKEDKVVPAELQAEIVKRLKELQLPARLIEIAGGHGAPPADIYVKGLSYVLSNH